VKSKGSKIFGSSNWTRRNKNEAEKVKTVLDWLTSSGDKDV